MSESLFSRIRTAFRGQQKIHPVEGRMAKFWIKQRLLVVFPELRDNPAALEAAYRSLDLQPREGDLKAGEDPTVFEMKMHREPDI